MDGATPGRTALTTMVIGAVLALIGGGVWWLVGGPARGEFPTDVCPGRPLSRDQARELAGYAAVLGAVPRSTVTDTWYLERSVALTPEVTEQRSEPIPTPVLTCLAAADGQGRSAAVPVDGIDDPTLPKLAADPHCGGFWCSGGRRRIDGGVLVSLSKLPPGDDVRVRWTVFNGYGGSFATVRLVRDGGSWRVIDDPKAPVGIID
jgi:hypothetical protein